MARARSFFGVLVAGAAFVLWVSPTLEAQEQFQFVIAASDASGAPVTDLKPEEVIMSENGVNNEIVNVEPFHIPVELTITVDNGLLSKDMIMHYRSGLTELVDGLPPDVPVTLIATAPQPRSLVLDSTERDKVLRAVSLIAPENAAPRFSDALVEFSKRYQKKLDQKKKVDSKPVLLMVSTTANEYTSYQVPEIEKAIQFMQARKAKVYVAIALAQERVRGLSQVDENRQSMLAVPMTKATGGRYETMANSSRLATLLPEFGKEIAALHNKLYNQLLVTVRRAKGVTGPIRNPTIEIARSGINGQVSIDGFP